MAAYTICPADEIKPGGVRIVEVAGRSIGIFNINGEFYALKNVCPHKFAPLCEGVICGLISSDGPLQQELIRQGEIIRCPWHGWEFDIKTGASVFNPHRVRVKVYDVTVQPDPCVETYNVEVKQNMIVVHIGTSVRT